MIRPFDLTHQLCLDYTTYLEKRAIASKSVFRVAFTHNTARISLFWERVLLEKHSVILSWDNYQNKLQAMFFVNRDIHKLGFHLDRVRVSDSFSELMPSLQNNSNPPIKVCHATTSIE